MGLAAILNSMTVGNVLGKLNISANGLNLEQLQEIMDGVVKLVESKKQRKVNSKKGQG